MSAIALALSIGYGLASLLTMANWRWILIGGVFIVTLVVGLQILRDWRRGITAFFLWIVVEDLIRKYMGNQIILYAAKDLLIVMTYASFLLWRRRSASTGGWQNPVEVPLLVCLGVAIVNCFNTEIDHPLVPLVGLRMNFFYLPLLVLGYVYFDSDARVRRFLLLSLVAGGVVALLGLAQSLVGLGFLNPGGFVPGLRLELIRVTPESQLLIPRPNSVFVDAGRFSQYLFVLFYLGLGAICYWHRCDTGRNSAGADAWSENRWPEGQRRFPWEMPRPPRWPRWTKVRQSAYHTFFRGGIFVWVCFGLIVAGLFVSAQRAVIVLLGLSFVVIVVIAWLERLRSWVNRGKSSRFPLAKTAICAMGVIGCYSLIRWDHLVAVYRFCLETLSPLARETELTWRPYVYWQDILKAVRQSGVVGHGTGTASLGLQYVYDLDYMYADQIYPYAIEGGYASVIWEAGLLGLAVWLWWTTRLVIAGVQTTRLLRGSRFHWLGISLSIFIFCFLFPYFFLGMQVYQNYVTNAYHWFLCGLLFRLPALIGQAKSCHDAGEVRRPLGAGN
ncbi:MAG TPA: hypothetical protein VNM72_10150 [Blastocatellia bacterium]|nr:hypothetical protein [Blastocatellia bacterium]